MAKYFYDCEFIEGKQKRRFLGQEIPSWFDSKPTIDLISIGIVCEDNRTYYAISKDFNLEEAWNRYDIKVEKVYGDMRNIYPEGRKYKEYWIRENVLKPIFIELHLKDLNISNKAVHILKEQINKLFTYKNFKKLIKKYGKSNKQIAFEVLNFVHGYSDIGDWIGSLDEYYNMMFKSTPKEPITLFGYYSAYDHVALCWLFGKMIDLPKGFPMYTIDLKQELDSKINLMKKYKVTSTLNLEPIDFLSGKNITFEEAEKMDWDKWIKENSNYPKQINNHHALNDARWNLELYKFLKSL